MLYYANYNWHIRYIIMFQQGIVSFLRYALMISLNDVFYKGNKKLVLSKITEKMPMRSLNVDNLLKYCYNYNV